MSSGASLLLDLRDLQHPDHVAQAAHRRRLEIIGDRPALDPAGAQDLLRHRLGRQLHTGRRPVAVLGQIQRRGRGCGGTLLGRTKDLEQVHHLDPGGLQLVQQLPRLRGHQHLAGFAPPAHLESICG